MRILSIFGIVSVIVVLLLLTRPDIQAELQPLALPRVETERVRIIDLQPISVVTGKLQPARKAHLHFQVSGQLTDRHVEPGQVVASGELLLEIDDGDFSDAVAEARAIYSQEEKAIERDRRLHDLVVKERELLQRELKRLQRLDQQSLTSKTKYDEAQQRLLRQRAEEARLRHSVETAQTRLQTRTTLLNRARRKLDRTRLIAPFNATVNAVEFEVGDYVSPGQSAIDLVQLDELDLSLEVTGAVASSLALGREVNIFIGDQIKTGKIVALAADPDANTNTYAIRIRLSGEGLFAGQLARAELPGEFLSQVLVVPLSAILREQAKSYVFTLENNRVIKTPITLIKRYQALQAIDGILPETRIVARDVAALEDKQKVSVE